MDIVSTYKVRVQLFSKIFILLLVLYASSIYGAARSPKAPNHKTICLNMIVKDEKEVIEKSLASAKPIIDYWVIVDTGSTDGTQEVIKNFLKDIPGELHERPWKNFKHNRNEALELAKGKADYLLWMDADEYLSYDKNFCLPALEQDYYYMTVRQVDAVDFLRPCLLKDALPWKWEGVLHEHIDCTISKDCALLEGVINLCNTNDVASGRSKDPKKYLNDAAILEEALKEEPDNSRYVFYLAQSYNAAGKKELALKNYEKRAQMPSHDYQETYFALYNSGKLKEEMYNYDSALKSYFKAHEFLPRRAEPLFRAAVVCRKMGHPVLGYLLAKEALSLPYPNGDYCVEYKVYDYEILIELANCALLSGKWQEGLDASLKLKSHPRLPDDMLQSVTANCKLARDRLASQISVDSTLTAWK